LLSYFAGPIVFFELREVLVNTRNGRRRGGEEKERESKRDSRLFFFSASAALIFKL